MKRLIFPFLAIAALIMSACSDDEQHDVVKEIRMSVSAETGITYDLFDDERQFPIECMKVMTDGNSGRWEPLMMNSIEGFTYERGHEYYLSVKKTILANPPADGSDCKYALVRILEDRLVADPEVKVDIDIKTEADIKYNDMCPFEKYSINRKYVVDGNGSIYYENGNRLPSYDAARIWLEDVMANDNPDWRKFHSVPYMAIYSYVISPFTSDMRLVRNESSGPMFKNVIPKNEFDNHILTMKSGDEARYSLVLTNVEKKGLQKLEFVISKK